jgi:predicted histone-like DNA-binding protein
MAKIYYRLKKNTNDKMPKCYGKWYPEMKHTETLNTRKMARHIAEHGSIFTSDVVLGVLEKFRTCLIEMLLESKKVKIDGLGTFYTTIEGTGVSDPSDFSLQKNIEALHIRFLPEREQELNIAGPQFLKQAHFTHFDGLTNGLTGTYYEGEEGTGNSGSNSGGNSGGSGSGNSNTDPNTPTEDIPGEDRP